jgi:ABC-type uncharacterized transport system ATPase subunit
MSDIAIRAENLSKKYRIQPENKPRYGTLRDQIARSVTAPFKAVKNISQNIGPDKSSPRIGRDYI